MEPVCYINKNIKKKIHLMSTCDLQVENFALFGFYNPKCITCFWTKILKCVFLRIEPLRLIRINLKCRYIYVFQNQTPPFSPSTRYTSKHFHFSKNLAHQSSIKELHTLFSSRNFIHTIFLNELDSPFPFQSHHQFCI